MGAFIRRAGMVALFAATMVLFAGCEVNGGGDDNGNNDGSNDDKKPGGSVVGTWAMNEGTTATGNYVSWWVFNADGTCNMYDDAGLTAKHLYGTYSQDGNKVTGPFTNPGVGDGELDCTLGDDGKSMQMDFIEHWHSPYKHVPYTGTKL